jgi:hypothetical protein
MFTLIEAGASEIVGPAVREIIDEEKRHETFAYEVGELSIHSSARELDRKQSQIVVSRPFLAVSF